MGSDQDTSLSSIEQEFLDDVLCEREGSKYFLLHQNINLFWICVDLNREHHQGSNSDGSEAEDDVEEDLEHTAGIGDNVCIVLISSSRLIIVLF